MLPSPPAPETAATRSGVTAGQIGAWRIGASMPKNSQNRVRSIPPFLGPGPLPRHDPAVGPRLASAALDARGRRHLRLLVGRPAHDLRGGVGGVLVQRLLTEERLRERV